MSDKIHVLYLQTQEGFGADSAIHAHLMQQLNRERFGVHAACTDSIGPEVPDSLRRLQTVPQLHLRVSRFAPGIHERNLETILKTAPGALEAPLEFIRLARYIKQQGIRIIHSSDRPRDSLYCVLLARAAGAKSLVHVHVKWSQYYGAAARWAVNHADGVMAISEYVAGTVAEQRGRRDTIYTVLNGIDLGPWNPELDGSGVRAELSIPRDALVLASISRLFHWKGQRELLKAFALVERQLPNAVLLIVGADAPHEGGSFTEELRGIAGELGVSEKVRFTGARNDIPQVMAACDVFTMPSFEEPFGLVFVEAMAMAKPVVAIDNGGTPEVVAHGKTGLLAPPWDVQTIAEHILRLLKDRELRLEFGRAGRERALSMFSAERMARDAERAYHRILERGSSG